MGLVRGGEGGELVGVQAEVDGAQGRLEVMHPGGADDRRADLGLMQQPGEGGLGRGDAAGLREREVGGDDGGVAGWS